MLNLNSILQNNYVKDCNLGLQSLYIIGDAVKGHTQQSCLNLKGDNYYGYKQKY